MPDAEFPRLVVGRDPRSLRRVLLIQNARTKEPILMFGLKHEAGASPIHEIVLSMDETKLTGSFEEERWALVGALAEQLTMAWKFHQRQLREQAELVAQPIQYGPEPNLDADWLAES